MTDTDTNTARTSSPKAPSHVAYHVRLQLDCVPLDGRVTLRITSEKSA